MTEREEPKTGRFYQVIFRQKAEGMEVQIIDKWPEHTLGVRYPNQKDEVHWTSYGITESERQKLVSELQQRLSNREVKYSSVRDPYSPVDIFSCLSQFKGLRYHKPGTLRRNSCVYEVLLEAHSRANLRRFIEEVNKLQRAKKNLETSSCASYDANFP